MKEVEIGRVEEARPARGAGGTEDAATLATVVSAFEDGEPLRAGEGFARCRLGIGLDKNRLAFELRRGKIGPTNLPKMLWEEDGEVFIRADISGVEGGSV